MNDLRCDKCKYWTAQYVDEENDNECYGNCRELQYVLWLETYGESDDNVSAILTDADFFCAKFEKKK